MVKERIDLRIPKDIKERLQELKDSKGINYTEFIVLALREKFDRLDNPDNYLNPNSPKLNGIRQDILNMGEMIKKEMIELYRITELKQKTFEGKYSVGIEKAIITQLESLLYNGMNKLPKTIKSIIDRLEKDGYNFSEEEIIKVLRNSEKFLPMKVGNIQGYILREEATNNE